MVAKKWLILLLLSLSPLVSAQQKFVSVATLSDYAPLIFSLNNQPIRTTLKPGEDHPHFYGYSWDVFRESFHSMGYTIHLRVDPWARALKELERREVDLLFPAGENRKRLAKFNYSNEAINTANFTTYVAVNNPLAWYGLNSLNGLNIGMIRGFNYGNEWNENQEINKINVKNIINGLEMLAKGRIDGFVGYEINWDHHINQQGWTTKFRKLPVFGHSNEYVVALKENERGQQLLNDFDIGKQKLIETGRLHAIKVKWSLEKISYSPR